MLQGVTEAISSRAVVPVMPLFSLITTYMRFTDGLTRRICSNTTLPTKPVTPVCEFRQLETNEQDGIMVSREFSGEVTGEESMQHDTTPFKAL